MTVVLSKKSIFAGKTGVGRKGRKAKRSRRGGRY